MMDKWQRTYPSKISSEAPVLVMRHREYTYSPGGAGNAAVNCAHLGAYTVLVALVGHDSGSDGWSLDLRQALSANKVNIGYLVNSPYWQTIEKLRIVDDLGRHLLRIDTEDDCKALNPLDECELRRTLREVSKGAEVLLVSDYGKGTCDPVITRDVIKAFKTERNRFVVVNGKPANINNYWGPSSAYEKDKTLPPSTSFFGADVLVFNVEEAKAVVGNKETHLSHAVFKRCCRAIPNIVITHGDQGVEWLGPKGTLRIAAPRVAVADSSGAGDTLCSTLAAYGGITEKVLQIAVINAAKVVSQHGTSVPGGTN